MVSESGLVSALGGKWTTYRKMSEDIINTAIPIAGLPERNCITQNLPIHGFDFNSNWSDPLHVYGTDIEKIKKIDSNEFNKSLSKKIYITKNQIIWSIRNEMAMTLEDILSRRTRCLFIDALETIKIAPIVCKIMSEELKESKKWMENQLKNFTTLANNYIIKK